MAGRASVVSGLEIALRERGAAWRGRRIGLISNQASVTTKLKSAVELFHADPSFDLVALFGPEHGVGGGSQDMVAVGAEREPLTGLQVHSLYGPSAESLSPTPAMLDGIDLLVADLQDVGARYYTFAATIALALEAIAPRGGRLAVLDRPNPIGGREVEGPGLLEAMRSFVGHITVPIRHGLTMGELLSLHAERNGLADALEIVPVRGWRRSMRFEESGLPWIPPSPNMPTLETARVYPGTCLVEATNLSEGRGTTRPFEWIGAPFLDDRALASALEAERLPGVAFRPIRFVPAFHKWAGRPCGGIAVHVLDARAFRPVRTGVAILSAARRLAPAEFAWRSEPYEFVADRPAIDLLTGSPDVRSGIDAGIAAAEIFQDWPAAERAWEDERRSFLLYT